MISVVIPVYKDWDRLSQCLKALDNQTDLESKFEVLVVNNYPSDSFPEFPKYNFDLILLSESKPGSYAARNRALKSAKGNWLLFTDSDCIPFSDWLAVANNLSKSQNAELFAGRINVISTQENRFAKFDQAFAFPNEKYVKEENFGVTANLLVKREVFEKVGQFNAQLMTGGDSEFCNRAHIHDFRIKYCEDLAVSHPARESWQQLKTKAKRFGGRLPKGKSQFIVFLKLIGKFRVRQDDIQQISDLKNDSSFQRLEFFWIKQQLRWVEALESMKVFFGKTAGRE